MVSELGESHQRWVCTLIMTAALLGLVVCPAAAQGVEPNTKIDGYRGIWFSIGQANEWGPKYSGGLGTYTANHVPIAVYAEEVDKTFFVYGGVEDVSGDLLIMASWYDHATCMVPRPTVVHHKVGIKDPHDDGALLIDRDGYLWVFISGRARNRTGWIYRSVEPYSTDEFEWKRGGSGDDFFEITYPQPWYLDNGIDPPVFFHTFTRYTAGRELYWATSLDGVNWSDDAVPPAQGTKLAGFGGHYQTSVERNGKIATAFNFHPSGVDSRTNLYYLQTTDAGATWTTADGTPVTVPLSTPQNPALLVDYQAQGLLVYINDTNIDDDGNPYIVYITSHNWAAGPGGDPRTWRLARWDGQEWVHTVITTSTHNYDVGSIYIEGDTLRVIGPTGTGPQDYGTGGEVGMWISHDKGAAWNKVRDVTWESQYNHSYIRRPSNARDPFYGYWADGHALMKTDSRLYFCNRAGTRVWRLPFKMEGDFARPQRITDFSASSAPWQPLWRSPFETMAAGPVTHEQTISTIRNTAGGPGVAVGDPPLTYAAYGQPEAGSAPAPGAGLFAALLPDDRGVGINTGLPSDAGNLQNALTFEGFFRTPDSTLITSPTFIGRRLVTQKRSADDGSSRLAIGLHAATLAGGEGLFDYEGFSYSGTALEGQAGGIGWGGPWTNATSFGHLSDDGISVVEGGPHPHFPFESAGSRISGTGGTSARLLSRPVDLSSEGTVTYLSALMRKTATTGSSGTNLEIGLATSATVAGTSATIRIGMTSTNQFFLTNSSNPAGTVVANTPYFVVVKIVSRSGSPDQCFMNVYEPGDTVPATEPANWLLTHSLSSSAVLTHLRMTIGANLNKGEIDEIRVGSSYAAVTDPSAPIATGGGQANVLSVFWHDTDGVNYLESGVTPIQPDTWYHFALVYDGTLIQWYLDGALEGQVAPPNLVDAASGILSIGNNRISGVQDRGFYGLLDEVRIADQALSAAEFLLHGGSCEASCGPSGPVLWCSGFEAEPGAPVSHGLADSGACGTIENAHGIAGSAAGESSLSYVAYGQPGVGDAPAASAGEFAILFPDDRSVAVNTNIPSNAGALNDRLTFEGFFNTADMSPITSPSSVGRRLVTQKRSTLDAESRLAIGLHASAIGSHNVLAVFWKAQDQANHIELGTTPVQPDTWYHFALVYDGAGIRWYLNGNLEGQVADAPLAPAGSAPVAVGNGRVSGVADRGFHGMLDEIRIVDSALTPAEFLLPGEPDPQEPCQAACPFPFADADEDGDVDQSDFGIFQTCITGSQGWPADMDPGCLCFDRNGDDVIDELDFQEFLACVSGAAIPWAHQLAPDCMP